MLLVFRHAFGLAFASNSRNLGQAAQPLLEGAGARLRVAIWGDFSNA
jgi:hypothetical protein